MSTKINTDFCCNRNHCLPTVAVMKLELIKEREVVSKVNSKRTGHEARSIREMAQVSLRSLAAAMKLSAGFISDLELGRRQWKQSHVDNFNKSLKGISK